MKRIACRPGYTIGRLYIDGEYWCDTLEDRVRDLAKDPELYVALEAPAPEESVEEVDNTVNDEQQ